MPNAPFPILFYEIGYLPPSNGMISKNSQMDGYCEGLLLAMFTFQFHYLLGTEWQNNWYFTGNDINQSG